MDSTVYVSQQETILQSLAAYVQNPDNWPDGIPRLTDLNPGSIIYTLLAADAVGDDALGLQIFMTRNAAYLTTATGADLDNKVADLGLTRKDAVPATGSFTFRKNNPATATTIIPSGSMITTVPTPSQAAVVFITDHDVTLAIGQTSVVVPATCQTAGSAGNIAAGTQLLISSAVPGLDTVTLETGIFDGADQETDEDLRARGLAAFPALARGTVISYQEIALSVDGIGEAIVVPRNRGPGTLDIFVMGPDNSIPSDATLALVRAAVELEKVATDDVEVLLPTQLTVPVTVNVHLSGGVDVAATVLGVQDAITAYIEGLGISGGPAGHIYNSHIVAAALTVDGVYNATSSFADQAVAPQEMPVTGVVTVHVI